MDNIRAQYAANAKGLRSLLARAEQTGRKANGYTADELRGNVARYERLSRATDAELRAHLAAASVSAKRRLLMQQRDAALAAGDVATFQSLTTQIADLPLAGVAPLTAKDKARYARR